MDNVDFSIKRGDRSPEITATLRDKTGAVIDPAGKTVIFKMRSFNTGELLVNNQADVIDENGINKVRYAWQDGDTDIAGYAFAEWEMELAPGVTQTFPTNGWHLISISGDLDNPAITPDVFLSIRSLRRLVDASDYSDTLIAAMLAVNGGDVNATTAQIWREKASEYAGLVDVAESGSSRKMSQLYDRAIAQAKFYEASAGVSVETVVKPPRVGRIVRQP